MNEVKDLVVLTFAGSYVKSIKSGLSYEECAKLEDEMFEAGYPSIVLKDASSLKVGDDASLARNLKRSQG